MNHAIPMNCEPLTGWFPPPLCIVCDDEEARFGNGFCRRCEDADVTREMRILEQCDADLSHTLATWAATHGRHRTYARWNAQRAVLACRMARGALAAARPDAQMQKMAVVA